MACLKSEQWELVSTTADGALIWTFMSRPSGVHLNATSLYQRYEWANYCLTNNLLGFFYRTNVG